MKKIGLYIFLIAFTFFNVIFFTSHYKVTEPVLTKVFTGDKGLMTARYEPLKNSDLLNKEYSNKFSFLSAITTQMKKADKDIVEKYKITKADVQRVSTELKLDTNKIHENFSSESEISYFKKLTLLKIAKGFKYQAAKDQKTLNKKVAYANKKISRSIGYSSSTIKRYRYELARNAQVGFYAENQVLILFLTFGLAIIGGLIFIIQGLKDIPGIKNHHIFHRSISSRRFVGILFTVYLVAFYILLYFHPEFIADWTLIVNPIKNIFGAEAGQWDLYGILYTVIIVVLGVKFIIKYRHNKYQQIRTFSVIFFQVGFAFLIPQILGALNYRGYNFVNAWPLDYSFFEKYRIAEYQSSSFGMIVLVWGIALTFLIIPLLTFLVGKRFYCSWVCGCGGLAETAGDEFRQLSSKKMSAWKIERWLIHGVMVFVVLMTAGVLYTYFTKSSTLFGFISTYSLKSWYGFYIGSIFSGVIGTGLYPILGNRSWCRFGCPLAGYMGLVQRFKSRFRITTNGGQCISCGNCSTYCEQGIDVRWYAQRGQNIVRSSCVGCGVCSAVCPRGVLNLENGPSDQAKRLNEDPILIGKDEVSVPK